MSNPKQYIFCMANKEMQQRFQKIYLFQRIYAQSLRGGGSAFSSSKNTQGIPQNIQIESQLHSTLLNGFLVNLNKKIEQVERIKDIMSTEEGKGILCRNIIWFQELESLFCYFQFQIELVKKHKQIIERTLQYFLELASMIIQWDRLIALQILKICNSFARLIFIYYLHSNERSNQQQISKWTQLSNVIINQLNLDGETQLFYNGFNYELNLIKACIEYIPTQEEAQKGNDCALGILKEIFNSAIILKPSPDLLSSISKGALFLYQQFQKKQSMEQFQNCLYLEQLKWNILMSIKSGVIFNEIEDRINDNFNTIIKKGSDWAIQYSWIKMASELMSSKPLITKIKFLSLQQESNQVITWEQAQSENLINVINKDFEIAEIIAKDSQSNFGIKLQNILRQYRNLQNFFMNGNDVIPQFIGYYSLDSTKDTINLENEANQDYFKMIQALRQIPFEKVVVNINEFLNKFSTFLVSYYQIDPKTMKFNDFQYHLILTQEQYQSLLNDLNKFQISLDYIKNIIETIAPLLLKSDEVTKQQGPIYFNCFQAFLYNYSKIQSKKLFDKKRDIFDNLMNWLQQNNLAKEQQVNYQKQFGKKMPENNIDLSKISDKSFQEQLNFFICAIQFCQFWNQQVKLLTSLLTAEHVIISQQISITKQTTEIDIKQVFDKLIEEFNLSQNNNFEYYHSIYSILKFQCEQLLDLKTLLYEKLSLEEFEKIEKKQKIEFKFNQKFDFDEYFQYQIHQYNQFIQLLETENQILLNQMKDYKNRKLSIILNIFCTIFNSSILSINSTFNFSFDFIKKMELLLELVCKKDSKMSQNFISNYNKLISQIDLLLIGKEKIDLLTNAEYVEKVKEFEVQVQIIQQELLITNNSEIKTQLINELNKFNEFLVHARTRQKNQLDSTIQDLKKCTLNYIDKIVKLFKNFKQTWKQELITEMSESIDERKPNQSKLQDLTNNFKQSIVQVQQFIDFSDLDTLQNLVDLMKFTEESETLNTQCEDWIDELQRKFQIMIQNLKNLQFEAFCSDFSNQLYVINQNPIELERFLKDEMNFIFQQAQNQTQANFKQCKQSITSSILSYIKGNSWRVKEGFLFQCIQLENQLQDQNKQAIQKLLIIIAAKETDLKILVTLKNKQIIQQMYQGFSKNWPDVQSQIQSDLASQINKLEQIQFNIQNAETDRIREQLLKQHKQLEEQVEQQIMNVNQIGDALGITINFLREIRQDLHKIQQKLDQMLNKLDEIVQDIKQLIGKTPKQLLEIRMQSVLQQKIMNDFNNVYVNLRTKELKENFKDEDEETTLFNDVFQNKGEIDEFLLQPKDSLLIHGPAGSGKSVAAKKIEEYIWLQYQQLNLDEWSKDLEQIPIVPIFIQLASLKDPYLRAVEETLASNNYNFDWRQIQAFQTLVEEGKVAVVFILDSFDELSNNQINLILNNKLKNWKQQLQNLSELTQGQQRIYNLKYPKIITTTRSEVFELNSTNYRQWFSSEALLDFTKYKELRILSFDDKQKQDYLKQFCYIQIKQTLLDYFEKFSLLQKKGKNLINEVGFIWNTILQKLERQNHYQQSSDQYLSDKEINMIISTLKTEFKLQNKQDQFAMLERQLKHIQTPLFYNNNIIDFNLEQLLKTPFMMKIVIDVLPQINSQKQEIQQNYFISNYTFQMYQKYVKQKDIKAIRQFFERISLQQYKEDQANEQNNQSVIAEQLEELEQDDLDKQYDNISYQQQQQQYQQQQQQYQQYQNKRQSEEVAKRSSQQQKSSNYYQQTTQYQEPLSYPRVSQAQNLDPYVQRVTTYNQYNRQDASSSKSTLDINNSRNQYVSYEDKNLMKPSSFSQQYRDESNQYRNSYVSSQNDRVQQPQTQTQYVTTTLNYPQTIVPSPVVQYQQPINQPVTTSYPKFRNQNSVNLRLLQELKFKQSLEIKIIDNLKEYAKLIWYKLQKSSQLDYDQSGEDKQIILKCFKSFKLTQYDFYFQFLQNYIQNQMQKLSTLQQQKFNHNFINQVHNYARLLSSYMMEQQLTALETQKLHNKQGMFSESKIKQNIIDARFAELLYENSEEITLVKKCLPLKQTGTVLSFEHKSIQEFIYAKSILENLSIIRVMINKFKENKLDISDSQGNQVKIKKFIFDGISIFQNTMKRQLEEPISREMFYQGMFQLYPNISSQDYFVLVQDLLYFIDSSPLNFIIMANQFYMGAIRFLIECIQNNQELKSVLHLLVLLSSYSTQFVNISSNSLQLLSYMQELFCKKDFTKIQIKDVKLLGIKCISCDFTYSKFENVTLMGANLNYCKIAKVEWKNVISQDLPTLSFKIGPILKASFSPDGNFIASLSQQSLVVYLLTIGQIIKKIDFENETFDFCWTTTKSMLVYFTNKETINIFNLTEDLQKTKRIEQQLKIGDVVQLMKFSNLDNYLSIGCQKGKVVIYKFANLQFTQFREIIGKTRITAFDFSPEEDNLILCDQNSIFQYKIVDSQQKSIKNLQPGQQVTSIVFTPDGQFFAYATTNEGIIIHSLLKQKEQAKLTGHQKAVRSLCFSNDGNVLISGGDDKCVRVWDYMKGMQIGENLQGHSDVINSVEFSKPDGMIILSAGKDGLIKQWHHSDNYRISEYLPGHEANILFIVITQDSERIITKGKDKKIIQWNIKTGSVINEKIYLQSCQECSISKLCSACSLSPIIIIDDDQYIITGGFGHQILIFDCFTGKPTNHTNSYLKAKGEVAFLAYSQQNHLICSSTQNGEIKIWNSLNGRQFGNKINVNYQISILTVFFSLDQNLVVLGKSGGYINFIISSSNKNASSFQFELKDQQQEIKQINSSIIKDNSDLLCLAIKSDYSYLAIASKDSNIYILDTKNLSQIYLQTSYQGVITSMHFDKNSFMLLISFEDHSIKIIDLLKNKYGIQNNCHQALINCICLSQDKKFIVSSSSDKCLKIWQLQNSDENEIITQNINELNNKILLQQKNYKLAQENYNLRDIREDCVKLIDRVNYGIEMEKSFSENQMYLKKLDESYHHLIELKRVDMSATLRAQRTLKDDIAQERLNIEDLLKKFENFTKHINEEAMTVFMTCLDQLKFIENKLITRLQETEKKQRNIISQIEMENQEDQQASVTKVNQQNSITFSEILCISKTAQNSKFIGTAFELSIIQNKTNHDLFKLWQQTQDKDMNH